MSRAAPAASRDVSLQPEAVAGWFFRLNGCFPILNFVLHPDRRGSQRTDADIIGVRFPHRLELHLSGHPLIDYPLFARSRRTEWWLGEITRGPCKLNGPWTDPRRGNLEYVLAAVGAFPRGRVKEVARAVYERGLYADRASRFRLMAIGSMEDAELPKFVAQVVWPDLLRFIHQRFNQHRRQKANSPQWDSTGRALFDAARSLRANEFIAGISGAMGL